MTPRSTARASYANVVSTLALVIAVGGTGAAVAAVALPNNSVGSPQIKNNSVKSNDLKNNAIKSKDLKNNSVTSQDVRDGTLTQADLAAGPVGVVRAYAWMNRVNSTGPLDNGYVFNSAGGAVTSTHLAVGSYRVIFADLAINLGNVQITGYGSNSNQCKVQSWSPDGARVLCYDHAGNPADSSFSIAMIE